LSTGLWIEGHLAVSIINHQARPRLEGYLEELQLTRAKDVVAVVIWVSMEESSIYRIGNYFHA
jgi:hypothetical protein